MGDTLYFLGLVLGPIALITILPLTGILPAAPPLVDADAPPLTTGRPAMSPTSPASAHTPRVHTALRRARRVHQSLTAPVYGALNDHIFPRVVSYATHPLVILATMLLLAPLILDASNTALALILGNYTNVVSATVSSIVLATSLAHHHENVRRHDEHASRLEAVERHMAQLSQLPGHTSNAPQRDSGAQEGGSDTSTSASTWNEPAAPQRAPEAFRGSTTLPRKRAARAAVSQQQRRGRRKR